eukprot:CAMPEP_0113829286 /NCGR_PEP_ID=MMETSP0328-20130328/5719_1 /TAXON_ID=39455 /ORGANISM="Alexandrium minutum" /LENGTH=66 /DNA_ID=CAMNT_0000797331 /DNA_START=36 /DNA_END=234 /DNA_ORIENTATION=+ /assembly_acc=CAM_ASM_000350
MPGSAMPAVRLGRKKASSVKHLHGADPPQAKRLESTNPNQLVSLLASERRIGGSNPPDGKCKQARD